MSREFILLTVLTASIFARFLQDASQASREPVPLRIPFAKASPNLLGPGWVEENRPLDPRTLEISRVSDYLNRNCTNREDGADLWFYVGYVDHWDRNAIHHPDGCFPRSGLQEQHRDVLEISIPALGRTVEFNEVEWINPLGQSTYTLYSLYYSGKFEPSERRMRADRILGIRYFAVLTISGPGRATRAATREDFSSALRNAIPKLLKHFPAPD